jgi:hypothetical protein
MSVTHNIKNILVYDGVSYTWEDNQSAGSEVNISEVVADAASDLEIALSIDVSALKAFLIVSTQDLTVETNDGTTPDHTFTLTANVPIVWTISSGLENPFDDDGTLTDITSLFATNASGADATLTVKTVQDPTP